MCLLCWDDLYRHGCPCAQDCPKWNGEWTAPCSAFYRASPCWGEAWHRDIPKRKPRRTVLIRSAWQHVIDFEAWVGPIHTIAHEQEMVMLGFYSLRRWGETPPETTQVCLSLMD